MRSVQHRLQESDKVTSGRILNSISCSPGPASWRSMRHGQWQQLYTIAGYMIAGLVSHSCVFACTFASCTRPFAVPICLERYHAATVVEQCCTWVHVTAQFLAIPKSPVSGCCEAAVNRARQPSGRQHINSYGWCVEKSADIPQPTFSTQLLQKLMCSLALLLCLNTHQWAVRMMTAVLCLLQPQVPSLGFAETGPPHASTCRMLLDLTPGPSP